MKKKYGLFKVLSVLLLLVIMTTYFVDSRDGGKTYLALGDVFFNYLQSFGYFYDTALFILVVGGFYGLLNRIPSYRELLKKIANKLEGKSKMFVIAITIVLALISSLTGFNVLLLLFVPMVVSIILLLGYDKLVALSATVGSIIVGLIGGVFLTIKDPSSYYAVSYTTIDKLIGVDSDFTNLIPKILLLVLGVGVLVWYIIRHIKQVEDGEVSYKLSKSDSLFVEPKEKTLKNVKEESAEGVSSGKKYPLIIVFVLLFVLLVLGYLPWANLFEFEKFNELHTFLIEKTFADWKYGFLVLFGLLLAFTIFKLVKKIRKHEFNGKFVATIVAILIELGIIAIFAGYSVSFISKTVFGEWVAKLAIWDNSVLTALLSSNLTAFGAWGDINNFMMATTLITVFMVVLAIVYRIKFEEFMEGILYGVKKMLPAVLLVMLAYTVFLSSYNHGFVDTIISLSSQSFLNSTLFNSVLVLLSSILNVDLYYASASSYATIISILPQQTDLSIYAVMFQSLYGLVQIVGPTSVLLIVGLSYLEVPYKSWLKYIWRFVIALLIVILIGLIVTALL